MPNIDALLQRALEPTVGLVINKDFAQHGSGQITGINDDDPAERKFTVRYADSTEETMGTPELTGHLNAYGDTLRAACVKSILGAYA